MVTRCTICQRYIPRETPESKKHIIGPFKATSVAFCTEHLPIADAIRQAVYVAP